MAATFKGVVQLTEAQYNTLKTNGTITVGDVTLTYDQNTLYVTTDSTIELADCTSDSTHRTVSDAQISAWDNKQSALPTTTTAGQVLKSTSTAGTVEWGTLSASSIGALPVTYDSATDTYSI